MSNNKKSFIYKCLIRAVFYFFKDELSLTVYDSMSDKKSKGIFLKEYKLLNMEYIKHNKKSRGDTFLEIQGVTSR